MAFVRKVVIGDSSNIMKVAYDLERKLLLVEFLKGGVYRYDGVTRKTFGELVSAESVGHYLATEIKGKHIERKIK